jgi:predicted transposase/invertase (TIGR01784 family)
MTEKKDDKTQKKNKNIPTPHDLFFKANLENKVRAKKWIQTHINKDIVSNIDFKVMQSLPTEFIQSNLRKVVSDVLYSVKIKGKDAYIYFLLEHQSSSDELMAFRMLTYTVQIMQWHLSQGNKKLPLVIPCVLYHGKESPYPYSSNVVDCFEDVELAKEYAFRSFDLIDLTMMDDKKIEDFDTSLFFEYMLKHSREKDFIDQLISILSANPDKSLYFYGGIDWINKVLSYIESRRDIDQASIDKLIKVINKNTDGEYMTTIERWREESKNQGVHIGEDRRNHEMAIEMLKDDHGVEMVVKYSKLSLSEVTELKKSITH